MAKLNLAALEPFTTAASALSGLMLVTPQTKGYQPQNLPAADGTTDKSFSEPAILFNYEGEQTATLESDITDHYIEDNTAIQDQIALKPELITTHGFIGELNDVVPDLLSPLKFAAEKLAVVGAYVPKISTTATLAYQEATLLYNAGSAVANAAVSAWDAITGGDGAQTQQQVYFQKFYGYWKERRLFTIQTPWAVFPDMAIKTLRAIQDAQTDVITDFEVTFKRMRFASTLTSNGQNISFAGRLSTQASGLTDQGTSSPTPSTPLSGGLSQMGAVA